MSTPTYFPGYAVPQGTYSAPPVPFACARAADLVQRDRGGGRGAGRRDDDGEQSPGAVYVPAQLRTPADGHAGRDQSPVHRARRRVFGVVSRRGAAYKITTKPNGVTADLLAGDGGTLQLFSEPAANRSPEQIAKRLISKTFPDTRTAYKIRNAMVGYQPGYGEVADCWPQGMHSSYMRMRVIVMVAVKNDLALVAAAVGPFRQFGPDFGSGKPSGANLQIALDIGKYVNGFSWRGDPPR